LSTLLRAFVAVHITTHPLTNRRAPSPEPRTRSTPFTGQVGRASARRSETARRRV